MNCSRAQVVLTFLLFCTAARGSPPELHGTWLTARFNETATLGDDTAVLSFDPDGDDYLPDIDLLLIASARERFAVSFDDGTGVLTLLFEPPPASSPATASFYHTLSGTTHRLSASFDLFPIALTQLAIFDETLKILTLEVTLKNTSDAPLSQLAYLRAVNPDPDLTHEGSSLTLDTLYQGTPGDLAVATGELSGRSVGLGLLQDVDSVTELAVGFCYRCTDPGSRPEDRDGRLEDWDLALSGLLPDLAPSDEVTFAFVYLANTSRDNLIAEWELLVDEDSDGATLLHGDCDDRNPSRYPLATESCDNVDQDCDGLKDESTSCYDDDLDGFSEREGDCDDTSPSSHPGAAEGQDTDMDGRPEGDGLDNDCDGEIDEGTDNADSDGDLFSIEQGDCHDQEPSIAPGALEVPYDGVDQNCDGEDLQDVDGDGVDGSAVGGLDCRDSNETIYPGALETVNQQDDDCDGFVDELLFTQGLVLFNEVMADPLATVDRDGEYLELLNTGEVSLVLDGFALINSAGQRHEFPLNGNIILPPQDVVLLVASSDYSVNGGLEGDGQLDLTLANTRETLTLEADGVTFDTFAAGEGSLEPIPEGASLQRAPGCTTGEETCFCPSRQTWAVSSDMGSPGATNFPCPLDDDHDGYEATETGGTDCDDLDPSVHPDAPEDGGSMDSHANGVDDDCDGDLDEGTLEVDDDGDSFSESAGDCDDAHADVSPEGLEVMDGRDNDCDGVVDPSDDVDQDGFTLAEGDCDDSDSSVYPGSFGCGMITPSPSDLDQDGDGYGEDDCDDFYSGIHPGAADACGDGIDQDCSGVADDGCELEGCGGCDSASTGVDPSVLALLLVMVSRRYRSSRR